MDLTICGVETPQAPGRSTLLRPELMQLDAWEAAGNQSPQNSQTPLFSAVLNLTQDEWDVPQGPGFFLLTGKLSTEIAIALEFRL